MTTHSQTHLWYTKALTNLGTFCKRHVDMHFLDLKYSIIFRLIFRHTFTKCPIEVSLDLVWVVTWRRKVDKPFHEPMKFADPWICVTRPQWLPSCPVFKWYQCIEIESCGDANFVVKVVNGAKLASWQISGFSVWLCGRDTCVKKKSLNSFLLFVCFVLFVCFY